MAVMGHARARDVRPRMDGHATFATDEHGAAVASGENRQERDKRRSQRVAYSRSTLNNRIVMSGNSMGLLFAVTSFGESHGPAIGCVVDGCPPGLTLAEADIQRDLDRRKPGTSRHVTQRRESDMVEILSGVFEGRTTGTPIALLIRNEDARSKDYAAIADSFRPGHADYTYWQKYGIRDYRGGGRQSARETAVRVAAGAVARKWLRDRFGVEIRGHLAQLGPNVIAFKSWEYVESSPFFAA